MIFGIGTDIVLIDRMRQLHERHGKRAAAKLLNEAEQRDLATIMCKADADTGRFIAKRFAAKEAFGKAFGTGIRAPITFTGLGIAHDELGKPVFQYSTEIAALMQTKNLIAHVSISDERDHATAFVVIEKRT